MAGRAAMRSMLLLFTLLLSTFLHAQAPNAVPDRFTSIVLGATLEEVKAQLQIHPLFRYRGDPDLSLVPIDRQPIIETAGVGLMLSGIFQFKDERLYSIILRIDDDQLDYFTMYTRFIEKYGEASYLDPQLSYWEQDGHRMVLEKPTLVKYLDMDVFNRIREEGRAEESFGEYSRELFLSNF